MAGYSSGWASHRLCVCVNLFISPPSAWVVFRWPYWVSHVLWSQNDCSQRCSVRTHGRSAPASCSSSSSAGAPRHIDYESVKQDLRKVPGVKHVHSVHIWSLTMSKTAIAAHLALGKDHSHSLTHSLPAHTEPGSQDCSVKMYWTTPLRCWRRSTILPTPLSR